MTEIENFLYKKRGCTEHTPIDKVRLLQKFLLYLALINLAFLISLPERA